MTARRLAAALVALALLTGLVVGFVLGSAQPEGNEVARRSLHASAASDVNAGAVGPQGELARSEANARTNEVASHETAVSPIAIRRAAATAPAVSPPTAAGPISGRVVDSSGSGVAGVDVRVSALSPDAPTSSTGGARVEGLAPLRSLEAELESAALAWVAARSHESATHTDAEGRFELPALGGERGCRIDAHLAGWSVTPRGANDKRLAGDRVEFLAQRLAEVEFALVREDGTALEQGVVEIVERGASSFHDWTRGAPVLALAPGYVDVCAHDALEFAGGAPRSNVASGRVAVEFIEGESRRVELVVLLGTRVVGRIEESDGRLSRRRQSVIARQHVDGRVPTDVELRYGHFLLETQNGEFDARGLDAGAWEFAVRDLDRSILSRATVDVVRGRADVRLVLPPEQASANLRVRVLEPHGRAASDFVLDAVLANGKAQRVAPGECDGEGWYTLRLRYLVPRIMGEPGSASKDPWSDLAGLRLCAVSKLAPYSGSVDVPPGASDVTLLLESPGVVEVVVHGLVGSPFEVATRVEATRAEAASGYQGSAPWSYPRSTRTAGGSTWTFDQLAPGVHYFSLLAARGALPAQDGGRRVVWRRVDVRPGLQRIEFTLPTFHTVHVSAPGLHEDARIELEAVKDGSRPDGVVGSSSRSALDAQLRTRFVDVTPGRYAIECDDLRERVEFDVPCAEVVIDAPVWNAQRVIVTDPSGAMFTAGLRDGDLVVAVDGTTPVTPSRWSDVFDRDFTEPCDVVVVRAGERITLDFCPVLAAANDDHDLLGGEFVRAAVDR